MEFLEDLLVIRASASTFGLPQEVMMVFCQAPFVDRLRISHQNVPEKENSCYRLLPNATPHPLMPSTKPLKEAVSKRSTRSYLVFLTASVTAFALYRLSSSPTEYTVCSSSSRIYTVDELQPQAQCITIKNDRIIRVGKHGMLRAFLNQRI